jgi:hypothetical protein
MKAGVPLFSEVLEQKPYTAREQNTILWSVCIEKYYLGSLFMYVLEMYLVRNGNSLLQPTTT